MGLLNIFGTMTDKIQKMEKNNDIVGILEILNKNIEKDKETAYECALSLGRLKNKHERTTTGINHCCQRVCVS
jgi:hypothetical protein